MAQVHITEAELARDLHAVLERVRQGAEVIVERDAKPVAVIKAPQFRGRPIDECIALAKAHGSHATLDEEFGKDLEDVINSHRDPLDPPEWD
jgi:antitoxin (DNA-binding transcriptional repressor) of toxin-antitoxin stability system